MIILLVEDNPDDIDLTKRALAKCEIEGPLFIVRDGQNALDYLFRRGEYVDYVSSPTPDLILLDLKLPKIDGLSVLKHIKRSSGLRKIPVIMLTNSTREEDVASSYDFGVNSYVSKSVDFAEFLSTIKTIEHYWGRISRLPM